MITIASYHSVTEAHIAKGLLESQGIHCIIKNENVSQTLPIGAVELMVDEKDMEKAQAVLSESDV